MLTKPKGKGACPTHLWATWREIRNGGAVGYRTFGNEMTKVVATLSPDEDEDDVWAEKVESLRALVCDRAGDAVIAWFGRETPRLMSLVPPQRYENFLAGVYEAADEDDGTIFEV